MGSLPETMRGAISLRRKLLRAHDGLIGLAQVFEGDGVRVIVTHGAWLLALVETTRGKVSFPLARGEIVAPRRFVLSLPPQTVLPMRFASAVVRSDGVASFADGVVLGPEPALLDASGVGAAPLDLRSARGAARAKLVFALDADAAVASHVARARRALHDMLGHAAPVREAARKANVAPETLTRAFEDAYRITPKQYCHRARLFAGALRLLSGKTILEAAFDAGFNDVTRFYTQFRRLLGATPGAYAAIRKRQDAARDRER